MTIACKSGGAVLATEVIGEGPSIVMLHAGVADRRMWRATPGFKTIAFDRRGFGETATPDEPFRHIDDLDAVITQQGDGAAHIIGCSQGGRIAIDYALAWPERVLSLLLVAPALSGASWPDRHAPEIEALLQSLESAEASGDIERVNAIEAQLWLDGPMCTEGRVGGAARELFLDMNGRALRHPPLSAEIACPPAVDRLHTISAPTRVVCGTFDFPHIVDTSRRIATAVPDAGFDLMTNCAHLPPLEQPEAFATIAEGFFGGLIRF